MKAKIYRNSQCWYWGILIGICDILKGLLMILTLGHYSTNLTLICTTKGAHASHMKRRRKQEKEILTTCRAGMDGECNHPNCPQKRDGEPDLGGRYCPLPHWSDDPEY